MGLGTSFRVTSKDNRLLLAENLLPEPLFTFYKKLFATTSEERNTVPTRCAWMIAQLNQIDFNCNWYITVAKKTRSDPTKAILHKAVINMNNYSLTWTRSGNMQSQASFNVFRVNHLNDISENPFRFAVSLEAWARTTPGAGCSHSYISNFALFLYPHYLKNGDVTASRSTR